MSYPPETKQCMHCGGRLGRTRLGVDRLASGPIDIDDFPDQAPRRGLLRTGLGSIWILLALTATCYRVCTG
ncbi:MAG: hypothetical protein VX681_00630 [Myxococcota bacterium]|nr:hypothetical protein [Myxococcota bacterium]